MKFGVAVLIKCFRVSKSLTNISPSTAKLCLRSSMNFNPHLPRIWADLGAILTYFHKILLSNCEFLRGRWGGKYTLIKGVN
jgi:hypothetical protein